MNSSSLLAGFFKVFADPTRIQILTYLLEGEKSVGEIASGLEMSPSAISHQLNTLKMSNLVKSRREGKQIYYSLNDEHVSKILSCGIEHIEEG